MDGDRLIVVGICDRCKHLDRSRGGQAMSCTAFPQGIPRAVRFGKLDHTEPVDGDHGIRFEELK